MSSEPPPQLRNAVAELLETDPTVLLFERITEGFSHDCFRVRSRQQSYFVKVYALGPKRGERVSQINTTTEEMRRHGIPAPELVAYSPRFPNVVIHRYVNASKVSWDFPFVSLVAELYSDVLLLGLPTAKYVSKTGYLVDLKGLETCIAKLVHATAGGIASANEQALTMCQQAVIELTKALPDDPLLVLNLHDDYTEKNILADQNGIKLLCDWDTYRPSVVWENLACSCCRFSSSAPMQGKLLHRRLASFLRPLPPEVIRAMGDIRVFARLFSYLGIMRHLRTLPVKNRVVAGEKALADALLRKPLDHCGWMLDNQDKVASWVEDALVKVTD